MANQATPRGQLAFDEQLVEDTALERALEARESIRLQLSAVRAEYDKADEAAKALIGQLQLPTGSAIRVGRFRIAHQATQAHAVAFEAKAGSRVRISLWADE